MTLNRTCSIRRVNLFPILVIMSVTMICTLMLSMMSRSFTTTSTATITALNAACPLVVAKELLGEEQVDFERMQLHPDWWLLQDMGLTVDHMADWRRSKIKLQVITQKRLYSLQRLCDSLLNAKYVDHSPGVDLTFHLEADSDVDTLAFVRGFKWPFGVKSIHVRTQAGGLMAAVSECWYPVDDDEYAIILEDDIEVSPLYYVWAKMALLKYRYIPEAVNSMYRDSVFGISLYTPRVQELTHPRVHIDPFKLLRDVSSARTSPFLWQLPCSWGSLFYPEKWREFIGYLRARKLNVPFEMQLPQNVSAKFPDFPSDKYEMFIPNSRSNSWTNSWKKYFMEMISLRAYVSLYPNYANQTSFSTNHLEPGIHIHVNSKIRKHILDFRVPLMPFPPIEDKWFHLQRTAELDQLAVWNQFAEFSTMEELQDRIFQMVIHPLPQQQVD